MPSSASWEQLKLLKICRADKNLAMAEERD
jgi:hypothetical protein